MSLRFVADKRPVTHSALTFSTSLETAFSQAQWDTFEDNAGRFNEQVEIVRDSRVLFRGYFETSDGDDLRGFSCSARSLAVQFDLYDATGAELFRDTSVLKIARTLGIRCDGPVGEVVDRPVAKFRMERGENYREALQRLAEAKRVVITDDAQGRLRAYALPSDITPAATWVDGRGSVTEPIRRRVSYAEWRNEWVCRGLRQLVAGDNDPGAAEVGFGKKIGASRTSRKVLPNKAASSKADAAALLDWTAKKALAEVATVDVVHNALAGWPGDIVRVRSARLGINDVMVVQALQADIVRRRYQYTCVLPDVYSERPASAARARDTRPSDWEIAKGPVPKVQL